VGKVPQADKELINALGKPIVGKLKEKLIKGFG